MANVSKQNRRQRPPKPEFSLIWVAIGLFAGEALSVIVEVAVTGVNHWVMLAGGAIGATLGTAVEGWRYWQSRRRWQQAKADEGYRHPAGATR